MIRVKEFGLPQIVRKIPEDETKKSSKINYEGNSGGYSAINLGDMRVEYSPTLKRILEFDVVDDFIKSENNNKVTKS